MPGHASSDLQMMLSLACLYERRDRVHASCRSRALPPLFSAQSKGEIFVSRYSRRRTRKEGSRKRCAHVAASPFASVGVANWSAVMELMCLLYRRVIPEVKNPPQASRTVHVLHTGRYSFFQSEMDLRA